MKKLVTNIALTLAGCGALAGVSLESTGLSSESWVVGSDVVRMVPL